MLELTGKHNTAKVYTDNIDSACIAQVINLLNQVSVKDSKIRIMPDCHAGAGCVIGTTMTIHDKVIPNLVGVDIGCGMLAIKLKERRIDLPNFDSVVRKYIPSGPNIRKTAHTRADEISARDLRCFGKRNCKVSELIFSVSLGSMGGNNHFIELNKDAEENLYLVIHSGSRRSGKDVAEFYQKTAYEHLNIEGDYYRELAAEQKKLFIEKMKKEGKTKELSAALKTWKPNIAEGLTERVPYEMSYCQGELLDDYLHDMQVMQRYASLNREIMAAEILKHAKLHEEERFETIHNYIDIDNMILRKGAISAQEEEKVLIPLNMRDGSLICIGKGNPEWNCSAPHGAGRIMSRAQAKESISMSDYKQTMKDAGIFTTSVRKETIDESPFAYKPMQDIIDNIGDTVDIVERIVPIYNFKASGEED